MTSLTKHNTSHVWIVNSNLVIISSQYSAYSAINDWQTATDCRSQDGGVANYHGRSTHSIANVLFVACVICSPDNDVYVCLCVRMCLTHALSCAPRAAKDNDVIGHSVSSLSTGRRATEAVYCPTTFLLLLGAVNTNTTVVTTNWPLVVWYRSDHNYSLLLCSENHKIAFTWDYQVLHCNNIISFRLSSSILQRFYFVLENKCETWVM